jgi:triacylglycerol lipase
MFKWKKWVAVAALGLTSAMTSASAVTLADLQQDGPYAIQSQALPGDGFGSGTIHAPTQPGKYGLVAVCPGFVSPESSITKISQRLATHGFVVVTIATKTLFDFPSSRANQILAALQAAAKVTTGNAAGKIDVTRMVASGWSMGGGGTLIAASKTPALKAAVAYAPWELSATPFSKITVPTIIFGATGDVIAPVSNHAQKFYDTIPATTPKALGILQGSNHFFPTTAMEPVSANNIAWNKRFVDGNAAYGAFLTGNDPAWASFTSTGPF